MLVTCHYHSLVNISPSQITDRSWEFSRIDPIGRVFHQQLRGGEVVKIVIKAAGDEECLNNDEKTRKELLSISYLGPFLILKVAAPMIKSALQ